MLQSTLPFLRECVHSRLEHTRQVQLYLLACSCLTFAPNYWQQGDGRHKINSCGLSVEMECAGMSPEQMSPES